MDPKLTPDQKRIMLVLCDASEVWGSGLLRRKPRAGVKLVCTQGPRPIRETTTAAALVRKGLAEKLPGGRYGATSEGYWLGDALRIEDRLGKIPARRLK